MRAADCRGTAGRERSGVASLKRILHASVLAARVASARGGAYWATVATVLSDIHFARLLADRCRTMPDASDAAVIAATVAALRAHLEASFPEGQREFWFELMGARDLLSGLLDEPA